MNTPLDHGREAHTEVALRLHTFARRTCMDRHAHWAALYSELARAGRDRIDFGDYTDEAYAVFPRYNVLGAVLDSIEMLDPAALPSFEELRSLLIHAAVSASSDATPPTANAIQENAVADERAILTKIFREVSVTEFANVEPLFYRRKLSADEVQSWRNTIGSVWGAPNGYWYPLGRKTHPSLVALELVGIEDTIPERLRQFFADNAIARLIELREYEASYEIQADAAMIAYTGPEGFWTSPGSEWIIYCSHEGTITFGGTIAAEIGPAFPASHYDPSQQPHWVAPRQ
jgi:hypothetical protein